MYCEIYIYQFWKGEKYRAERQLVVWWVVVQHWAHQGSGLGITGCCCSTNKDGSHLLTEHRARGAGELHQPMLSVNTETCPRELPTCLCAAMLFALYLPFDFWWLCRSGSDFAWCVRGGGTPRLENRFIASTVQWELEHRFSTRHPAHLWTNPGGTSLPTEAHLDVSPICGYP